MKEWEWPALAVDLVATAILWKWYRDQRKTADLVQSTALFPLEKTLSKGQIVPYAGVEGVVKPLGGTIRSMFGNDEGVIQNITFIEHKTKKEGGFWRDTKHVIRNTFNDRPFVLVGETPKDTIRIIDPLMADFLTDSLPITHVHFEPNKSTLLSRGLDRIFGDVSKGFEEKERLLPVGVTLLGFGKVTVEKGLKVLQPPDAEIKQPYILTTQTRRQVIQSLQGSARLYRVLAIVCGAAGCGVLAYIIYKHYRKWVDEKVTRALRREVAAGRERLAVAAGKPAEGAEDELECGGGGSGGGMDTASRECVVCLRNRREVILLDCGHICLCFDCSQSLPEPKKCPVCREVVGSIRNIYMP